ncbi:MAG: cell envelope integrity protein CreD [Litorimonas sp.]
MTDIQTPNPRPERALPGLQTRSLGLKLIVILFLIVLMAVPVMFISIISFERSNRADEVTREVSQTYGGNQQLLGPVIAVPYRQRLANGRIREGDYVVSALTGAAIIEDVTVEEKSRSLYKVPVYTARAALSATLPDLDAVLPSGSGYSFDVEQARIVVGLGDVTGLQSDVTLNVGGRTLAFEPLDRSGFSDRMRPGIEYAVERPVPTTVGDAVLQTDYLTMGPLTLLFVPAGDLLAGREAEVRADIEFTGANRLAVLPFARSTEMRLSSDWPHPGFEGRFPPKERDITEAGFSATWNVPFLRRGIAAQGSASDMMGLVRGEAAMEVNFVSPLNPYRTVNRALKYAVLFIGLVFLAYFLMETLLRVRVHPAQYLLIGIAQAVFYLLLLAFAEHVGFTLAFLISAAATVLLTAGYAGAVFGRDLIWKSTLVFGLVYALLFVLMRIQDFALMVGALISFVAVAATLYLTRNLDWYDNRSA